MIIVSIVPAGCCGKYFSVRSGYYCDQRVSVFIVRIILAGKCRNFLHIVPDAEINAVFSVACMFVVCKFRLEYAPVRGILPVFLRLDKRFNQFYPVTMGIVRMIFFGVKVNIQTACNSIERQAVEITVIAVECRGMADDFQEADPKEILGGLFVLL